MRKVFAVSVAVPLVAATKNDGAFSSVTNILKDIVSKNAQIAKDKHDQNEEIKDTCASTQQQQSRTVKQEAKKFEAETANNASSVASSEQGSGKKTSLMATVQSESSELAKATQVEKSRVSDYNAVHKELTEASAMLSRAITIISAASKDRPAFLQKGNDNMSEVVAALKAIVAASGNPESQKKAEALLQDDDLSLLATPQANSRAYVHQSSGIVATLEELQADAQGQLQTATKDHMNAQHKFDLLAQSLNDSMTNNNKEIQRLNGVISGHNSDAAAASKAAAQAKKAQTAAQNALDLSVKNCNHQEKQYAAFKFNSDGEKAACEKALEIISSVGKSFFVQLKAVDSDVRTALASKLRKLSRTYNSFQLMQIANRAAASSPFDKVRGMIETMISKLQAEASKEASAKEKCDKDIADLTEKRDSMSATLDDTTTKLNKARSNERSARNTHGAASERIGEIDALVSKETSARNDSHAVFLKVKAELEEALDAATRAFDVLEKFYRSGAGNADGSTKATSQADVSDYSDGDHANFDEAGPSTGAGESILTILSQVQEDTRKEMSDNEMEEKTSADAFDELMTDMKVEKKGKEVEVSSNKKAESDHKATAQILASDQQDQTANLDNRNKALVGRQNQCADKAVSYADRKAKRENEIAGLKEALTILREDTV